MMRRAPAVAIVAAILALVSGCSTDDPPRLSTLTIQQAKDHTQAVENEIAALIPPEYVAGVRQAETGGLLECGRGGYTWYGHTYVEIQGEPDFEAIRASIQSEMKRKNGYHALLLPATRYALAGAEIRGPFHSEYLASARRDGTEFRIMSFSPCFGLPDGTWTGGNY